MLRLAVERGVDRELAYHVVVHFLLEFASRACQSRNFSSGSRLSALAGYDFGGGGGRKNVVKFLDFWVLKCYTTSVYDVALGNRALRRNQLSTAFSAVLSMGESPWVPRHPSSPPCSGCRPLGGDMRGGATP